MLASLPFVVLTLAVLLSQHLRDKRRDYDWLRERQELMTRIQAPHLIPRPMPVDPTPPVSDEVDEGDEFDRLGEIEMAA